MKRNYGIWLAIAVILIVGIGSTKFTKNLVNRQEAVTQAESASITAAVGQAETVGSDEISGAKSGEVAAAAPRAAAGVSIQAEVWSIEESAVVIPPIGTPETETESTADEAVSVKSRYIQRLEELDIQVAQNRTNNSDQTTNTLKVNAEYELRVWETEMDSISESLSSKLNSDRYEEFLLEQRAWIRERESNAMEASKKHAGSALESVEYTASLAVQTRERVYLVVEEYLQILEME